MRKIKFLLLVLCISLSANVLMAQGIKFEKGTFAEALKKAKQENKLLFVDFYTSWCGPCKAMSKDIFPQKMVGDYFAKHFIALKINAEKGEGDKLAKKYKVKGFPTMIFFNPDGSENKRLVGATPNADFFLNFAKQVTGEEMGFLEMFKHYEQGNRNLDFIKKILINGPVYASTLPRDKQGEWFKKFGEISAWYFAVKRPQDMLNKEDFSLIAMFLDGPNNNNPFVEFIYNNYEAYKKIVPVKDLTMFIFRTNNQSIHDSYRKGNLKFRAYLEQIHGRLAQAHKDGGANDTYEVMQYVAEGGYCLHGQKDVDGYLDWSMKYKEFQKEKGELDARSYSATVGNLYHSAKDYITPKQIKRVIQITKEGLKLDKESTMLIQSLGDYYALLKNNKKARECYNKVLELTKGTRGESYYKESIGKKLNALK